MKLDKDKKFVRRLAVHAKKTPNTIDIGIRQAYILPTIKGLYYIITLIIMFIWSVNFAISLGYAITFLAGVFFIVIAIYAIKNLTNIQITALENNDFFAGTHSYFKIRVHTKDETPKIQLIAGRNGVFSQRKSAIKDREIIFKLPLDKSRRGIHNLDYVKIQTRYPIGIFRSWTWLSFNKQIIVYPKPEGNIPIFKILKGKGESINENQVSGSDDFFGLNEYKTGDSIKLIAWKKSTKGKLMVKEFNNQQDNEYSFNYNDNALNDLSQEQKLSQLCKWILEATAEKSSYELILPNKTIKRDVGEFHKVKCLRALACY